MHPLFDSLEYPWSNDNADKLFTLLKKSKKLKDQIDILYKKAGPGLDDLNLDKGPAAIWKEALENLAAQGYLRNFCEALRQEGKPKELMDLLEVIFNMESITDLKLVDKDPLLDRANLREQLSALSDKDNNTKVIIVRGEKQSGKTYGKILFAKVARANRGIPIYLGKGQVSNLRQVLQEIFAPIGGFSKKRDPEEDTTVNAWHITLCSTLLTAAMSAKATLWIAMDNLGKEGNASHLDEEIRQFFDQLVLQMSNDAYKDHFRLMLIDYPNGDTPPLWEEMIWQEDRTSQNDVNATHVAAAISSWARMNKLKLFEDEMKEKAESIIKEAEELVTKAPANMPVSRIKAINQCLQKYFKSLAPAQPKIHH